MKVPAPGIDYIGVGIGAVIHDGCGRFLLAKRGPEARNERGRWEFPGGALRFGETQHEAIRRELLEELGILVEPQQLLGVVDHILPDEGQHWLSPAYLCRIVEGEARILEPGKCAGLLWAGFSEIPRFNLSSAAHQTYQLIGKNLLSAADAQETGEAEARTWPRR